MAALSLAAFLAPADPARAQLVATDPASNSVLIDLSAIDGGNAPRATGRGTGILGTMSSSGPASTGNGQLLLPPQSAPSSRLLGPDGRALREPAIPHEAAPRLTSPREAKAKAAPAPKQAPVQAQAPAQTQTRVASAAPAQSTAKPALPEIALPSAPTPAPTPQPQVAAPAAPQPAPQAAPQTGNKSAEAPIALDSPTPAPSVTPPALVPSQELVGPQASVSPQATVTAPSSPSTSPSATQLKATPQQQKSTAAPAAKGPTPPPAVAAVAPADTPSPPPAAKAAPATPAPQQQAALPPATKSAPPATKGGAPDGMEIRFAVGVADLSPEAKASLDKLADSLKNDEKSRLQLLAYASEDQASPSKARRLSLSRALAVRSQLIAKGIRSTRIDVRALGDQIPGGEPNRVDLKVTDR